MNLKLCIYSAISAKKLLNQLNKKPCKKIYLHRVKYLKMKNN